MPRAKRPLFATIYLEDDPGDPDPYLTLRMLLRALKFRRRGKGLKCRWIVWGPGADVALEKLQAKGPEDGILLPINSCLAGADGDPARTLAL